MNNIPKMFCENVFRDAPVGIAVSDAQGYVVDANNYLLDLGGWKREDLEGKRASDFYVEGAQTRGPLLDKMHTLGYIEGHCVRFKRKDGTSFLATMSVKPTIIAGDRHIIAVIRKIDT